MPGAPDVRHPSVSTTGFADGLGRRSVRFDREVGAALECLHVRPELAAYEDALRAQSAAITALDDERLVRVRSIERDGLRLLVTSELVTGDRLLDIVEARAAGDAAVSGLDAAFGFLLQILPTLSRLHAAGLVHGAVSAGRITLTSNAQVVLGDAIYGGVLPRLHLSRRRLWTDLQIAAPRAAGIVRFDAAADVSQAALVAMTLALGRQIEADDPIDVLPGLLSELVEVAQIRGGERLASAVRAFFTSTLPVSGLRTGVTADHATKDATAIASGELGDDACLAALAEFSRYEAPAPPVPAPRPAAVLRFETPVVPVAEPLPPAPDVTVEDEVEIEVEIDSPEIELPVEIEAAIPAPAPELTPEPEAQPQPLPEPDVTTYAAQDPWTWTPASEPETVQAPAAVAEPPAIAMRPEPMPEPMPEPAPAPIAFIQTPPVIEPEPVAPPPPAPAYEPPAPEPLIRRAAAEFVYDPPPPPLVPMAPPTPAYVPPPPPAFVPPPAAMEPVQPAAYAAPVAQAPPAPGPRFAPPPAPPAPAPVGPPVLRLKQEQPAGYAAPRASHATHIESDYPAPGFGKATEPPGFPKKLAAALVIITIGAIVGGKFYMKQEAAKAEGPKAAPAKVTAKAQVANPATPSATGVLAITSIPSGAKVLLNGTAAGETPLRLDGLPPGRHTITLSTDSTTVKRTVKVEAGKELILDVPVFSGWVAIFAPIVLDVAEGGRGLGSTENGRIMLAPGRHVLTVSNRQLGYSETHTVEIGAGEEARLNLTPTGIVSANAQPWAEVWVDGNKVGETPIANLEVPLGTREFIFKHPQHGERRVTATVTASSPTALSVDFTKTPNQ